MSHGTPPMPLLRRLLARLASGAGRAPLRRLCRAAVAALGRCPLPPVRPPRGTIPSTRSRAQPRPPGGGGTIAGDAFAPTARSSASARSTSASQRSRTSHSTPSHSWTWRNARTSGSASHAVARSPASGVVRGCGQLEPEPGPLDRGRVHSGGPERRSEAQIGRMPARSSGRRSDRRPGGRIDGTRGAPERRLDRVGRRGIRGTPPVRGRGRRRPPLEPGGGQQLGPAGRDLVVGHRDEQPPDDRVDRPQAVVGERLVEGRHGPAGRARRRARPTARRPSRRPRAGRRGRGTRTAPRST